MYTRHEKRGLHANLAGRAGRFALVIGALGLVAVEAPGVKSPEEATRRVVPPKRNVSLRQLYILAHSTAPCSAQELESPAALGPQQGLPHAELAAMSRARLMSPATKPNGAGNGRAPRQYQRAKDGTALLTGWATAFEHWLGGDRPEALASPLEGDASKTERSTMSPHEIYTLLVTRKLKERQRVTATRATITAEAGVAPSTVGRHLRKFVEDGLVEETAERLALTSAGQRVLTRGLGQIAATGMLTKSAVAAVPTEPALDVTARTPIWTLRKLRVLTRAAALSGPVTHDKLLQLDGKRKKRLFGAEETLFHSLNDLATDELLSKPAKEDGRRTQEILPRAGVELASLMNRFGVALADGTYSSHRDLLAAMRKRFGGEAEKAPGDTKLRAPALLLLLRTSRNGAKAVAQLTHRLGISARRVTLDSLKKKRLIAEIDLGPTEKPRYKYEITDSGREVLSATLRLWIDAFEELPASLLDEGQGIGRG